MSSVSWTKIAVRSSGGWWSRRTLLRNLTRLIREKGSPKSVAASVPSRTPESAPPAYHSAMADSSGYRNSRGPISSIGLLKPKRLRVAQVARLLGAQDDLRRQLRDTDEELEVARRLNRTLIRGRNSSAAEPGT
jgi:hypothetical protein